MILDKTEVLEQAHAAVRRCIDLIDVTRQVRIEAASLRRATAEQRRRSFVLFIGGGASKGGALAEETLREKLARGTLPWIPAMRFLYTRGQPKTCVACDLAVETHEVGVDAEFELSGLGGTRITLFYHAQCFAAWQKVTRTSVP